tara:strand:- start:327 stop:614 length:288 start_codon:yes stop_codon:yes gene_type:complete
MNIKQSNNYLHSNNLLERLLEDKKITDDEYNLFIEYVESITERDHYHNVYLAEKIREEEYNLQDSIDLIKSITCDDFDNFRDSHWNNGVSRDEFI